jgi:hypothetical protein
MGACQRKTVHMLPDCTDLNAPALDGVTTLTGSAELTPMNVRVAKRAVLRGFAEHRSHVAAGAGNLPVLAKQWVLRLVVVVELGNCTNGSPRFGDVAVLTCNLEIAVRIASSLNLLRIEHQGTGAGQNHGGQ